jgi:cobalamin biosynthesis protein CobD/CbiB
VNLTRISLVVSTSRSGSVQIVELLINHQARTDIIGQRGSVFQIVERDTPQHLRPEIMRLLQVFSGMH